MKALTTSWRQLVVAAMAVMVFCYWYFLYPFLPLAREGMQLFLLNGEYFLDRIMLPGGFAQYVAEFFVQFFFYPSFAAAFYALLFVLFWYITSRLLGRLFPKLKTAFLFALSLLPGFLVMWFAMLPHVPLTPTIALLMVMSAMLVLTKRPFNANHSSLVAILSSLILIPIIYWLAGPLAILLLLVFPLRCMPVAAVLFTFCVVGSSVIVPYPLGKIDKGIDYYWNDDKPLGTHEEMECDMLVRTQQWDKIVSQFSSPTSPAVYSATYLARFRSGRMTQHEFFRRIIVPSDMAQREPSVFNMGGLFLETRIGSLASAFMLSDISMQMSLPAVSMRSAFEAMEFIPNYNKSGRSLRRLVETNLITGNYEVALKYITILEETICYRKWARQMKPLAEHPELLRQNPHYRQMQELFDKTDDQFFI